MAKGRGKKRRNKQKAAKRNKQKAANLPPPNKTIEKRQRKKKNASMVNVTSGPAIAPVTGVPAPVISNMAVTQENEKEINNAEQFPGFIFMCNGKTKPECFHYGVFGLPMGQMNVVQKVNQGTKLFLFDTDLKLLYGIYQAAAIGETNLEPAAFGGRYPAQVRFKISLDCLPLPESSFRHAIQENYRGRFKFKAELSDRQVKVLISLFRPIGAPQPVPSPHVAPDLEPHYVRSVGPPPPSDPYYSAAAVESRYVRPVGPPPSDPYYSTEAQRAYLQIPAPHGQDPYIRYRATPEMVPHDRLISLGSEYLTLMGREQEIAQHLGRTDGYHNHHEAHSYPPSPHAPASSYASMPPHVPVSSYVLTPPHVPASSHALAPQHASASSYVLAPPHVPVSSYMPPPHVSASSHALAPQHASASSHALEPQHILTSSYAPQHALAPSHALAPQHVLTSSYALALPHAPTLYGSVPQHAPMDLQSHQTTNFLPTMLYGDPNCLYTDPVQRQTSGRIGLAGGNTRVSSLYSFAGAAPTYH